MRYINERRRKGLLFPELNFSDMDRVNRLCSRYIMTLRKQEGLSRMDLVEGTGLDETEIECFESSFCFPSTELLYAIEKRLGLDLYPILYTCVMLAQNKWFLMSILETGQKEISENIGTLVFNDEAFEYVELRYITPANHNAEIPEVYVCRTREEGPNTFYTTIAYMVFPELDIYGNCLTFSGMMPVGFVRKEENSPTSFYHYKSYEYGEFKFYPYSYRGNIPGP